MTTSHIPWGSSAMANAGPPREVVFALGRSIFWRSQAIATSQLIGRMVLLCFWVCIGLMARTAGASDPEKPQQVTVDGKKFNVDPCDALADENGCFSGAQWVDEHSKRGAGVTTRGFVLFSKPTGETNTPGTDCRVSPKSARPVILATGEKTLNESDFEDLSAAGLSLNRTYRSTGQSSLFGPGWSSSFAYTSATVSPQCSGIFGYSWAGCLPYWIQVKTEDGIELTFYRQSSVPLYFLNGQSNNSAYGHINAFSTGVWTWSFRDRTYTYQSTTRKLQSLSTNNLPLLTFTHNKDGVLERVTSRSGRSIQFETVGGRVVRALDPAGRAWTYTYNANGTLAQVTPPSGTGSFARTYHYAPNTALLTGYSVNGIRKTRYEYDSQSRVIFSGLDNNEEYDKFSYGTNFTNKVDQFGQSIRYTFENSGALKRLLTVDRASTSTCTQTANSQVFDTVTGQLKSTTDFRGTRTDYTYTADGLLQRTTIAANTPESFTLNNQWSGDRIIKSEMVGSNGVAFRRIEFSYGTGGAYYWPTRRVETDLSTGIARTSTLTYGFHANGFLQSRTSSWTRPDGSLANDTEVFDNLGNRLSQTNAVGHAIRWTGHDALGRASTVTDANGIVTTFLYDVRGQILSASTAYSGGNSVTNFGYNEDGNVTSVSLPNGQARTLSYNTGGRLIGINNGSQRFTLDVPGRTLIAATDRDVPALSGTLPYAVRAGEFRSSVTRDSLGRGKYRTGATGQTTVETYDGEGNVLARQDPANRITAYEYDGPGRLKSISLPEQSSRIDFGYGPTGLIASVKDPRNLSTRYQYDGFGNMIEQLSPDSGKTTYGYNNLGQLTSLTSRPGKFP